MKTIVVTALDDGSSVYIPPAAVSYVRKHATGSTVRLVSGESIAVQEPPEMIVGAMESVASSKASTGTVGASTRKTR